MRTNPCALFFFTSAPCLIHLADVEKNILSSSFIVDTLVKGKKSPAVFINSSAWPLRKIITGCSALCVSVCAEIKMQTPQILCVDNSKPVTRLMGK